VDIEQATAWATTTAEPDRRFSIALVRDWTRTARGLVWLLGHDLNESGG
jgi:hypothetical protein